MKETTAWVSENAAFITVISFLIHFVQADIEKISLCLVKRKPTSLKVYSIKFAFKMEKKSFVSWYEFCICEDVKTSFSVVPIK